MKSSAICFNKSSDQGIRLRNGILKRLLLATLLGILLHATASTLFASHRVNCSEDDGRRTSSDSAWNNTIPMVQLLQSSNTGTYPTDAGSTLFSGIGSYSVGSEASRTSSIVTLNPSVVRFLASGIGMGLALTMLSISDGEETDGALMLGPKLILALGKHDSRAFPYVSTGIEFTHIYASGKGPLTGHTWKFGLGSLNRVSNNLCIPVELSVQYTTIESSQSWIIGFGVGIAGFLY